VNELFPVASGLAIGAALALLVPRLRVPVGVCAAVACGVLATIISGEYKVGWEYLLVDIPLVALSSAASLFVVRAVRRRAVQE
jgi:hypothetical protein